jgi:hypothetical protein
MSFASATFVAARHPDPRAELEEELRHVRDLVLLRELLRRRGAAPDELRECDAAIAGARGRLAESAKRASGAHAPAA